MREHPTSIRLSDDLKAWLMARAHASGRSASTELKAILSAAKAADETSTTPTAPQSEREDT